MVHLPLLFLSTTDMIVIAVVALFLFGGRKIPEFARGIGQSIKQFKEGAGEKKDDPNYKDPDLNKK